MSMFFTNYSMLSLTIGSNLVAMISDFYNILLGHNIHPAPETLTRQLDGVRPYQRELGEQTGIIDNEVVHPSKKLAP